MSAGQQYRAVFDFVSTGDGILSFKVNEQFTLVSKTDDNWWLVRSVSGERGHAPVTYLEPCPVRNGGPVRSGAYISIYDYVAQEPKQLSFTKGQTLFLVDKTDVSWWTMQNPEGKQGMVPVNYIDKLEDEMTLPESKSSDGEGYLQALASIDSNIGRIHEEASTQGGTYTPQQRATLQKLVLHRKNFITSNGPPVDMINHTHSMSAPASQLSVSPTKQKIMTVYQSPQPKRHAPPPPSSPTKSVGPVKSSPRRPSDGNIADHHKRGGRSKTYQDHRYSVRGTSDRDAGTTHDGRFESLPRRPAPKISTKTEEGGVASQGQSSSSLRDQQYYSLQRPPAPASSNMVKTSPTKSPQKSPLRRHSESNSPKSPEKTTKSNVQEPRVSSMEATVIPPNNTNVGLMQEPTSQQVSSMGATPNTRRSSMGATPNTRRSSLGKDKSCSSSPQSSPLSKPFLRSDSDAVVTKAPPQLTLPTSFSSKDGHELVEVVRNRTGTTYKKAHLAVGGVLQFIRDKVPQCEGMVDAFFTALDQAQKENSMATSSQKHSDLDRLQEIFFEVTECKDDSQQRGWAVHDDEKAISDLLEEMLQILCDANPEVTRVAIMEDNYENVLMLITYYQMEPRVSIRLLLLKVFGVLCGLDRTVIGVLLASVLPGELGRDIQQNITDLQKTLYSSTVCTMIFSTAENVPLPVYDQWDVNYVLFLLDSIENPPPEDLEEQLPDAFLNVVLSFNQHFSHPPSNLVMRALKQRPNPRNFSEKLMYLINRGEDPVAITQPCCPDSMTKFLLDLFSDRTTSGLFYTTDMMVLIDIVTRQLTDLCPGMETRTHYLELLYRIVGSTDYKDHQHRQRDLMSCLNRIAGEEGTEGQVDRELTRKIWMTYPEVFEEITDL